MPSAPIRRPPHQQTAETTPALRGPARSSQPPHSAAEKPSSTKNSVYIHPKVEIFQSQLVTKSSPKKPVPGAHATDSFIPIAFESGSQKTENPYAMPMHKGIASAAGGTSQRLNPRPAMVRSLSRIPGAPRPA